MDVEYDVTQLDHFDRSLWFLRNLSQFISGPFEITGVRFLPCGLRLQRRLFVVVSWQCPLASKKSFAKRVRSSGVCVLWSAGTASQVTKICLSCHEHLSAKKMRGAAKFIKFNDYSDASAGPSFIRIETFPSFSPFAVSLTLFFHSNYRNIYLR